MADLLGVELLTNPNMTNLPEVSMSKLDTVELPSVSFDDSPPPPKLMPSLAEVGPIKTNEGLENLNASSYLNPGPPRRMNEEHLIKEKYEMLRKFERLQKLGVPMRKRFTLESPLDEMKMELEFMRREKAADQTIKQFCDWYITAMSAVEWSSKNVAFMKAFGLQLDGLSESSQMNVGDLEEDFEELYDLYGDKLKMHPLVRIPIRTCMMVYMVHLTNQMARKAPIPNIDEVLRTNPEIARQLATAAMQQQTQTMKSAPQVPPPPSANPLSGLASFMSGMVPPPPPQDTNIRKAPTAVKPAIRYPKPQQAAPPRPPTPPPPPSRDMMPPSNIDDLLKNITVTPARTQKKGGSTGKNSVSIKL